MILVTGANGFLGSYICRSLLDAKKSVRALVRKNSNIGLIQDIKSRIELVEGDILDAESIEAHLDGVKVIIHAAAMVSFHSGDFDQMSRVNVEGTKNMVNLALKFQTEYFIHISSVAAIGRSSKKGVISENHKWQQSKWNSHYGESKYFAELEVWRGIQEGLSAVVLNPSVILGGGDWDRSSSRIFKYVWEENKYYSNGLMNYVDARDVTNIIQQFINNPKSNERYIVSAGHVTYKALFEKIADKFKKTPPKTAAKAWLLKLGLIIEAIKSTFLHRRPLITRETINLSEAEISFDNSKIKNELSFNFAALEDTVDWACSAYLSNVNEKIK